MKDKTDTQINRNQAQFNLFRKNFLSIQKKYERKIDELSILKEMVESMKSIDLKDQDLVWRRQLDCLVKYKNISGAVIYLLNDFQNKKEKYISSSFDAQTDYSFLKNTHVLKTIISDKKAMLIKNLEENDDFNKLEGSLYGLPVVSGEEIHGVLILFSNEAQGFEKDDIFFYSIVCGHLMNIIAYRRFYFGKINEEKHILQLSRFFSKNIVQEILKSGTPKLGGERKKACVVFVDLKDFTALSEKITSEEVLKILNNFFSCMIPIVFKNKGTLDKLIGDCIMAVFGAPIDDENSSFNAVNAVLQMFSAFYYFKLDHGGMYADLKMTVGINTGEMVAGFLGSENHLNYTVIGDTVNSAQRIQALAEANRIYLSESVFDEIRNDLDRLENLKGINPLGNIKLKGKEQGLNVYRMIPEIC